MHFSVEMGRVSCELDPQAAAERDAALREVTQVVMRVEIDRVSAVSYISA